AHDTSPRAATPFSTRSPFRSGGGLRIAPGCGRPRGAARHHPLQVRDLVARDGHKLPSLMAGVIEYINLIAVARQVIEVNGEVFPSGHRRTHALFPNSAPKGA